MQRTHEFCKDCQGKHAILKFFQSGGDKAGLEELTNELELLARDLMVAVSLDTSIEVHRLSDGMDEVLQTMHEQVVRQMGHLYLNP